MYPQIRRLNLCNWFVYVWSDARRDVFGAQATPVRRLAVNEPTAEFHPAEIVRSVYSPSLVHSDTPIKLTSGDSLVAPARKRDSELDSNVRGRPEIT